MAVFVLLLYFYTVMVIVNKRNLAQSPRKYAILTLRCKKNFWGKGTSPFQAPPHPLPTFHRPWRLRRLDSVCVFGARPCPPQLQLLYPPMTQVTTVSMLGFRSLRELRQLRLLAYLYFLACAAYVACVAQDKNFAKSVSV